MNSLITVGIPVFNVENYITECLVSVFNQTYENLEIIIVDDNGNDKSMTIVYELISKSYRKEKIKVIKQPHNMGTGIARNTIIKEAKGDYIFFIDSDDVITTDCIEYLFKELLEHNLDFVCCSMEKTDEALNVIEKQIFVSNYYTNKQSLLEFVFVNTHKMALCNCWNKIYKTDFLKKNKILFTSGIYYEDSFFFLKLINNTNNCAFLKKITYKYRQRQNSIMNISPGTFKEKEIKDMTYTLKLEKEYIKKFKGNKIYSYIILSYAKRSFFYFKSYYYNNNNLFIKPYINDLLYFPLNFLEIFILKENICNNLFFWFLNKIPYSIKCKILYINTYITRKLN